MSGIVPQDGSRPIGGVLFAAGAGLRLRPLTEALPKPALPLLDVPLGSFGLRMLGSGAGGGVLFNVSHQAAAAVAALRGHRDDVQVLDEGSRPLGTAGTLLALRDRLADRVCVVNGDLVTDLALADLEATHTASGAPMSIAVAEVTEGADFWAEHGKPSAFIDRRAGPAGAGFLYIGAAILERSVVDLIPEAPAIGLAEAVLRPLSTRGELAFHLHEGYACDVGTPKRYLAASLDLLEGRGPACDPPGAVIDVPGGRAYLGPGASAAEGALGPGAIVLAGATVAGRVQRSVVWPGERVAGGLRVDRAIWFSNHPIATDAE